MIKNELGNRYGKLTVIKYAGQNIWKDCLWECQCDCGNLVIQRGTNLRTGHTKSCGCLYNNRRKGFGESSFQMLYKSYKAGAERRGHVFSLDIETFRNMTSSNCFYCGIEPSTPTNKKGCYGVYLYNGIDRVDNHKGYTKKNTVPCCWRCNKLKGTFSQKEFKEAIQSVHTYWLV